MNKKKVVLVTYIFPYDKIFEAFLETEIKYWENQEAFELVILPINSNEHKRKISDDITIDDSFAKFVLIKEGKIIQKFDKFLYIFKSLHRPIFWKEIITKVAKKPSSIKALLFSMRKYEIYREFLKKYIKNNETDIFYTYWNTEATYVLQSLNNRSKYNVITRVHGHDLYKERTSKNYFPLRKQFTENIDQVFTITDKAIEYLIENYGYKRESIQTSRLGIEDKKIITKASADNSFYIVSCSALVPLKKIDKIIDTLGLLADKEKDTMIYWTHIGAGGLFDELKYYADAKLNKPNVQYTFLGPLLNQEVYEFYANNQVDVFISVSRSEGVPVSIMEAMSCHIPIVALDIGGISDMVISGFNGALLSQEASLKEIAAVLENISYFKDDIVRQNSYRQYKKYYDADNNYKSFIEALELL